MPQHLLPNGTRQNDAPPLPSAAALAGYPAARDLVPLFSQQTSAHQQQAWGSVDSWSGDAAPAPRILCFAPPSPPPLTLNASGDRRDGAAAFVGGRGRGRGRGSQLDAATPCSPVSQHLPREDKVLSASPLMAPGVSTSSGITGNSSFRVRIGERVITDGLCALLQGMLQPQISQPPLTANSLLSLLQKMAPPALTLGRTSSPSWLQDNTQQVCAAWSLFAARQTLVHGVRRTATSFSAISSAACRTSTHCSSTRRSPP